MQERNDIGASHAEAPLIADESFLYEDTSAWVDLRLDGMLWFDTQLVPIEDAVQPHASFMNPPEEDQLPSAGGSNGVNMADDQQHVDTADTRGSCSIDASP